ncbi:MAG: dihydrodipicolinate synthase family protein, partial [Devosia sp.]
PPPGLKTDDQVYAYWEGVLTRLGPDIPVCYQDYPFITNVHISVDTLKRIFEKYPSVKMLKHEDWPGHTKLSRLRAAAGRQVSILVGNGGLYLPQELARGANGAMTGFAYPEMLVQVCAEYAKGNTDRAEDIFDMYLPLLRHEAQPVIGIALRKETLRRRGAIASAHVRHPGPRLNADDMRELDGLIARLERRLAGTPALAAAS